MTKTTLFIKVFFFYVFELINNVLFVSEFQSVNSFTYVPLFIPFSLLKTGSSDRNFGYDTVLYLGFLISR